MTATCQTCDGVGTVSRPWVEYDSDGRPHFTTVDVPCGDCPRTGGAR